MIDRQVMILAWQRVHMEEAEVMAIGQLVTAVTVFFIRLSGLVL